MTQVSPDSHKEKPVQCSEVSADNDGELPKAVSGLGVCRLDLEQVK